jgi:drug/metabolite transporter (DMT)-like permease
MPSVKDYLLKVVPCGLATGLDIGLSNNSLKYITLSLYTMVKSSAPIFVLLFAFLFRLEKPTFKLVSIDLQAIYLSVVLSWSYLLACFAWLSRKRVTISLGIFKFKVRRLPLDSDGR